MSARDAQGRVFIIVVVVIHIFRARRSPRPRERLVSNIGTTTHPKTRNVKKRAHRP